MGIQRQRLGAYIEKIRLYLLGMVKSRYGYDQVQIYGNNKTEYDDAMPKSFRC